MSIDESNLDSVRGLAERSFLDLEDNYGPGVDEWNTLLYSIFIAACSASLSSKLGVPIKTDIIRSCIVVTNSPERVIPRDQVMKGMAVVYDPNGSFTELYTADGLTHRADKISIWLACTAVREIILGSKNLRMLKEYLKLTGHIDEFGRITSWPRKMSRKRKILEYVLHSFDTSTEYDEAQINNIFRHYTNDHALIRREMVVSGLIKRTKNGSKYWVS